MKLLFSGKAWRRIAFSAIALCLLATIASVEIVDYSPYFKQDYYRQTVARLDSASASNSIVTGELQAGFGRALLTPSIDPTAQQLADGKFHVVPLAGYGSRKGKPATGVHDDVYVKAVALKVKDRVGVMVGADALIIPRAVADQAMAKLRQKLGLKREQIYFGATHTHSSLGGWGEGIVAESFAGPFNAALSEWFATRLVAAVEDALGDLKPAALGSGSFFAPEFVRNRVAGKLGEVDPEFSFKIIKQTTTGRVGIIGSYAAHATVLSADNLQFSADYPGYWQRAIEHATGGFALFLAGGVGSHSPNPGAPGFEGAAQMGERLAARVLERMSLVSLTNVITFGLRGLEVSLPSLHARLTDQIRLRPWLARELLPVSERTFLQGFRLNNAIWISTPCDISGELALAVKDYTRAKGFECVLTSFNGDYIGYIIPSRYYHLDGYEPRLMSFYGPSMPDYLDDLIRRIAVGLWN
jgi:neutral ceramidase